MDGGAGTGFVTSYQDRKLNLDPEIDVYRDNILYIDEIDGDDVSDWSDEMHPRVYHELFANIGEEKPGRIVLPGEILEYVQESVLLENFHQSFSRPDAEKKAFQLGYSREPDESNRDAARTHWEYDHRFEEEPSPMEKLPVVGEYVRGRGKKDADLFYEEAARRIDEELGDLEITVL